MDALPIGEEQPEEKEKYPQPDVENCSAAETVASTECTDSRKEATGMDVSNTTGAKDEEKENTVPQGREAEEAKTSETTYGEDPVDEQIVELNSSPEKSVTDQTKEDALKHPELEVFSIEDEEEDEEEDMDDDDEEEEYDEMDEDYEVYVEEKESANPNNSMDDDASKLDISTDEYTDEEAEEDTPEKMETKPSSTPLRKTSSSDLEQDEEEDDDVQIISYDEEIEEDDEEEIEEEEDDDESDPDEEENDGPKRHSAKWKSDSGGSGRSTGTVKRIVKYRSYKQKQLVSIRKRAIRILNRRSMHVMEDNDDARAVSTDCKAIKLTTDLHSAFATPKQTGREDILFKAQEKNSHVSTSTDKQNETKDNGITVDGDKGDPKVLPKQPASDTAEVAAATVENPTDTISSTTSSNSDDKMPTATAVEVSEKIADSSDDAVSVLSSSTSAKKSVTAITPTVNSSASTEAAEQKARATEGTTTDTASKASEVASDASSTKENSIMIDLDKQESNATVTVVPKSQKGEVSNETKRISPSPTAIAEPTADDVMEGIDDFMEHTGSEEDEEKQQAKEFNDDLTFQMDVDSSVENSSSISNKEKREESAIDLTSTSEHSKEKGDESSSSEAHPVTSIAKESSTTSVTVTSAKEARVDMHDKTVVTSTPVTNQKKGQQKRADREQEAASSSLEVKQEHEEESDANEAQNLSKQKPSDARGEGNSAASAQKAVQSDTLAYPSASRKRRRSVEIEADRQVSAGRSEPDAEEPIEPAKKLKLEVEANYQTHERVVNDYIETTQNTSVNEIQSHTDALVKEIQALNDMIRETEIKWNNLLHLKKVKEEILLRLNRRKHVIGIMDTQLGEVSVYSHIDSSNLSSQHHHQQSGRSSSVGPRPPTPPPEVEIRPASVTNSMHYGFHASNSGGNSTTNGGDKSGIHFGNHSRISNRRSSSNSVQTNANTSSKARNAKDTNSFVSQFNSSNNAVTMVPLPNTTSMILNARASMNAVEVAKEKSAAVQIQRQILSKPILSNHQQILNNLAMSAGLTGSSGTASGSNNSSTALLNGHHNPGGSNSIAANQQQLQIGRQGMRKDVSSIIADYRQKHPEYVPRRGRRLKNVGGNSASNNGTSTGNNIGSYGEGGAISLTALSGGKSPANVRPNSTDSVANRISELLAAAEQSPQQHQPHHQAGSLHQQQSSLLSKASLPEVTLHPVMNSTAHSEVMGGNVSHGNGSLTGANLSAVNSSTNSLLHGILTKSANRPGQTTSAAAAAAAAVGNFNTFSPTLARLLTVPERMNSQSSSTVTSGALANLQTNSLTGGLNLSKNINEISITPVVGSNFQQTFLTQQQQQQTLQRLREQQLYNLDDEADDSADRLVIDEGDDMGQRDSSALHGGGKRRGAEINENEVPQCQGCKKQEAKFVCAGCGNQWYCSRACQVNAWDDHSEVCSG
ncbi:serine-rich adhesin for platelets-like isoform X2 [Anopheles funestus]|uniref:serine-rich adhesin for platelets-like isoform X2 n=1 Tax=Anopheles funestus TaxID=62324 RepID=UPI0020C71600|nr:serine-rich adhesin for platelets-like isoform X2 [Anopheles funestus]